MRIWMGLLVWVWGVAWADHFTPPVGIPAPEFGIEERWQDHYTRPDPWDTEVPGWYYVNRSHPDASDARTYGTTEAPWGKVP